MDRSGKNGTSRVAADWFFSLAERYLIDNKKTEAEQCYRLSILLSPDNPKHLSALGVLLSQSSDSIELSEAQRLLLEAHSREPLELEFGLNLVRLYIKIQEMDAAIGWLKTCEMLDPDDHEIETLALEIKDMAQPCELCSEGLPHDGGNSQGK